MTDQQIALLVFFITNTPIIVAVGWLFHKGIFVLGTTHREIVKNIDDAHEESVGELQKDRDFREQLRQEALTDKKALEERSSKQAEALKELTDVVRQSLDFNERLVEERNRTRPRSTGRSTGARGGA